MSFWNEERLKVGDYKQLTHRYFVRVEGDAAAKADAAGASAVAELIAAAAAPSGNFTAAPCGACLCPGKPRRKPGS